MAILTRTRTFLSGAAQRDAKAIASLSGHAFHRGLFRQFYPLLGAIWLVFDIAVALVLLYAVVRAEYGAIPPPYRVFAIFSGLTMLLVYQWSGLFQHIRMRTFLSEIEILLVDLSIVVVLLAVLTYFTGTIEQLSAPLLLQWWIATYFGQLATHTIVRVCLHQARKRSMNIRRALLVGSGAPMASFVELLRTNSWLGIEVEGYLHLDSLSERVADQLADLGAASNLAPRLDSANAQMAVARPARAAGALFSQPSYLQALHSERAVEQLCLGTIEQLEEVVDSHAIDQIYITVPMHHCDRIPEVTQRLLKLNVDVNWVPDLSVFFLISPGVRELDGQPILCLSESPMSAAHGPLKRLEDLLLGGLLVLLAAPFMAVIALAIKLKSPGPVFFVQRRHGLNGQVFSVLKFRTMVVSNAVDIARQASKDDPRITPLGHFLRRWSLDELPQLFHVLQGRMSLVGPRPHPLWLDDQYTDVLRGYMQRHRVKPGLTGWAQVNGWRGETDAQRKMDMRLRHDIYYINHWSLWLDLRILLMTVVAIFEGRNAR